MRRSSTVSCRSRAPVRGGVGEVREGVGIGRVPGGSAGRQRVPAGRVRVSPASLGIAQGRTGPLLGSPAMEVAYQGEPGAYSERAVRSLFPDADPMPCDTVRLVFSRVTSGEAAFGVVPLENSQAGSVNETYDLLQHTSLLHIVGEAVVRVDHALLAGPGAASRASAARTPTGRPSRSARSSCPRCGSSRCPCTTRPGAARMIAERGSTEDAAIASVEAGAASGPGGARRADPDREGELHEVRGDRHGRSRPRGRRTRPRS